MDIVFTSKVKKSQLKKFYEERLYVPGRLFSKYYVYPEDYPYDTSVVTTTIDDEIVGVCIYYDKFTFGWEGQVDGLVGAYVKPKNRCQGIAGKMLERMLRYNKKVMGYTYDLNSVVRKLNSDRLIKLR